MKKVLLDTDIGSDIDDALCVAYLLAQPECDLLGVTTVSGEAQKRAEMVSAICKQAGKDIPIYPGIAEPLMTKQYQPIAPQYSKVDKWPHEKDFPDNQAIEFMRRTIRENPGEVTLLAIGPLTNIAVLFSIDREIPSLLKELVLMCGRFTGRQANAPLAEWNAFCDPYATAIVYNADVKNIRSYGLDVTLDVILKKEEVEEKFQAELLKPVKDFASVWLEHAPHIVFHDPLATACIFDKEICEYKRGNVEIELKSDKLMGLTHFEEDIHGKNEIAVKVQPEKFFAHYFDVLNRF